MKQATVTTLIAILTIFTGIATAHHSSDFIEMETASEMQKGQKSFYIQYDYMVEHNDFPSLDHYEITPGFSYSPLNWLNLDMHTHFAKFGAGHIVEDFQDNFTPMGPSPFAEAFAITVMGRLPMELPIDLGLAFTFEQPYKRAEKLLDAEQVFEGCLVISKEISAHTALAVNVIIGKDGDEDVRNWKLGIKTPLTGDIHGISASLEMMSSLEKEDEQTFNDISSMLLVIHFPIGSINLTGKGALEFGLNGESSRVHLSVQYDF